jgi:hypothetical protein
MEKLTKETFERWRGWTEKIRDDLQGIVNYHQVYEYFIEMVNANLQHVQENHGRLFCDFVRKCYGVHAATGIRRHVKTDKDSISLMKLLDQLQKSASQFTYEFYLQQFPLEKDKWEWQKSTFAGFSENGKCLSLKIISEDTETIKGIAGKVSDFTDRAIAHLDQRGIEETITYDDLANSIGLFNQTACKYIALVTGDRYTTLKPTILDDWAKIFTVPLDIRKDREP